MYTFVCHRCMVWSIASSCRHWRQLRDNKNCARTHQLKCLTLPCPFTFSGEFSQENFLHCLQRIQVCKCSPASATLRARKLRQKRLLCIGQSPLVMHNGLIPAWSVIPESASNKTHRCFPEVFRMKVPVCLRTKIEEKKICLWCRWCGPVLLFFVQCFFFFFFHFFPFFWILLHFSCFVSSVLCFLFWVASARFSSEKDWGIAWYALSFQVNSLQIA